MKKTPYVFLIVLIVVLVFIIGFRSGQKTEKTNKIIDYILSITPYPTYTPYPTIVQPSKTATTSPTLKPKK